MLKNIHSFIRKPYVLFHYIFTYRETRIDIKGSFITKTNHKSKF